MDSDAWTGVVIFIVLALIAAFFLAGAVIGPRRGRVTRRAGVVMGLIGVGLIAGAIASLVDLTLSPRQSKTMTVAGSFVQTGRRTAVRYYVNTDVGTYEVATEGLYNRLHSGVTYTCSVRHGWTGKPSWPLRDQATLESCRQAQAG